MKNYPGKKIVNKIANPTGLIATTLLLPLSIRLCTTAHDRYIKSKQEELHHSTCMNRSKLVPQQLVDEISFNLWWDSTLIINHAWDETAIVLYTLFTKGGSSYFLLDENTNPETCWPAHQVNLFREYKNEMSTDGNIDRTSTSTRILKKMLDLSIKAEQVNPDAFKE